jgi:hypothetical protein
MPIAHNFHHEFSFYSFILLHLKLLVKTIIANGIYNIISNNFLLFPWKGFLIILVVFTIEIHHYGIYATVP